MSAKVRENPPENFVCYQDFYNHDFSSYSRYSIFVCLFGQILEDENIDIEREKNPQ